MERDHFSREWDDAPMPYSIFFTQEGHAIHGSYDVKHLGRPASHGCVRLAKANAAVLFALVKEQGVKATKVVLVGDIPERRGGAARTGVRPITDEKTPASPQRRAAHVARRCTAGAALLLPRAAALLPPRRYYGGFPFGW